VDGGIDERKKETTKSESDGVGRCVVEKKKESGGEKRERKGKEENL